jgi:hypothetical protein
MRTLVVHQSAFGDARTMVHAIADALSASLPADVVSATEVPAGLGPDVWLLVVGTKGPRFG